MFLEFRATGRVVDLDAGRPEEIAETIVGTEEFTPRAPVRQAETNQDVGRQAAWQGGVI